MISSKYDSGHAHTSSAPSAGAVTFFDGSQFLPSFVNLLQRVRRRRASARGARLADLVLCVLVDLAGAFGDAGAVRSPRMT